MITLAELLRGVRLKRPLPEEWAKLPVTGLEYDSRRVERQFVFFAFEGAQTDGRRFARPALEAGASAVVSDAPPLEEGVGPWIEVEHGREALAAACRNFFGPLDEELSLTAVTGTNGKTTVAYLIDSILVQAGKVTAVVGTIQHLVGGEVLQAVNTTPDSLDLYKLFERLRRVKGSHVTMEVSSHALALGRVHGFRFHTAVFTNLSPDHLDFHRTMEDYFAAKRLLFEGLGAPPPAWCVVNLDDEWGRRIRIAPGSLRLGYAIDRPAEVRATSIESGFDGLRFEVEHGGRRTRIESAMVGRINVSNILAAFGAGLSYGLEGEAIAEGIARCRAVPGRFERVDAGQPFLVVVDYAHTPDALENLIRTARSLHPKRVITLFGCGGNRDRGKRPLMGQAAGALSDFVVLTSDNPRKEDPLLIINDALVGLRRHDTPHVVEADRAKAIRLAIAEAQPGDIVLIAGKGHETYQILADRVIGFDDREVARRELERAGWDGEAA